MAFISVTRLRLRSAWFLPKFFWHAIPSNMQARKAPGNLGIAVLNDARFAFWTKTAWKDEASMRAYVMSGAHQKAMVVFADMCDEGCTVHWQQDTVELPTWQDGYKRLIESGHVSRVRNPSSGHASRQFPPPRA
ncbi:MAG: hypothetical protein ABIR70_15865 [Bryobacteraceae bacterium]